MGKKKLQTHREEPEIKKHRPEYFAWHFTADEVEVFTEHVNINGVVAKSSYTAKTECQAIQQIKDRIETEDELVIGKTHRIYLYPAFKEALLRLLATIEDALTNEQSSVLMILIHGVPNLGKTTLATCLSYFLALSTGRKETVHYVELAHSASVDKKVLTKYITRDCDHNYVVVDQVNTHTLMLSDIVTFVHNRWRVAKNRMPLVMFTSGHHAPSGEWLAWQNPGLLCYKLITMQIDVAFVNKLKDELCIREDDVSSDVLLKVTNYYSRMDQCLKHLRTLCSSADEDTLQDFLYPGADTNLLQGKSAIHFIWLAWQDILSRGLPPFDKFTEDDCKLSPHHVQYLGYLTGINAVLNFMDITGRTQYERNGYKEFNCYSYSFKFLHKKHLYDLLKYAVNMNENISLAEKNDLILSAYDRLTNEGDSQYQYLRGGLFELIIKTTCEKETNKNGYPVGMVKVTAGLDFVKMDYSEAVATDLELLALPLKYQECKEKPVSFWCVLNVPGKPPFKGFDFAYMQTSFEDDNPVVKELHLFQVTVNPKGIKHDAKENMMDVLVKLKTELVNRNLIKDTDRDQVVVPYFVHPNPENDKLTLRYGNPQTSIVVDILGFPKSRLSPSGLPVTEH